MSNLEIAQRIAKEIDDWKVGKRSYTFESRIFGGLQYPRNLNGEAVMQFHIRVDGFYEDIQCQKPITLIKSSHVFFTTQLSMDNPDNLNGDSVRLKSFLAKFTEEAYHSFYSLLSSYNEKYTADPLYW